MFWKKNNNDYVLKLKQDRNLRWIVESLRVPANSEEEFYDDLKRIKYIKRLFKRFIETGELRERLLLNHFIVLNNMFGADAAITLLLFKIEKEHWPLLKTFLVYLNMLRENELMDVEVNNDILKILEAL